MRVRQDGGVLTDDLGVLQFLSGGGVAWDVTEGPDGEVEATPKPLEQILREGQGLLTETMSRHLATNTLLTTSGTTLFTLMPVIAGQLITNLSIAIITAGAGVTLGKLGLYDVDGNRVAVTEAQTTAWQSTGVKTHALTAPYEVVETGVLYAAILNVVTTTAITIARCSGQNIAAGAIGSGAAPFGIEAGQNDLDATATIVNGGVAAWVGAS